MAQEVTVIGRAEFDDLLKGLDRLQREVKDLEAEVGRVSGKPLKIPTDPAEEELKQLRAELKRVETAYERALRGVDFARVIAETDKTEAATRRLARANQNLAARGKQLIRFSKDLPPELRKVATGLDKVEKEAEQAERAFRKLSASKKSVTGLTQSIGQLRVGVGTLIAALGIRQLIRFGRTLIGMVADAVEVKTKLDALIPSLRSFTGSTELAEEVADRLAATAAKLKVPLANLIDPFLGISAGGKEAGLSIAEINDLFEASLTSARAFGKGAIEVKRLLTGISQVAGKGVASMEEFRQQIGEAIPNAIPALARGLGITVPEAIAKISSGSFDSAIALRALTKGFVELNQEAGLAQVATLKGDLGGFAVAAEQARKVLADGLEPGLRTLIAASTDFLVTNKELIAGLGELGSGALKALSGVVELADKASQGIRALGEATREFGQEIIDANQLGFRDLGDSIRGFGSALTATSKRSEEFVKKVTEGFRRILNEGAGTSEELLEQQKKNFKEQAKAAGVAAKEIITIEKTIADKVGKIQEDSLVQRKALNKLVAEDLEELGKLRVETERRVATELATILSAERDAFAQLSNDLLVIAERAAAARIEAERKASEKSLEIFERLRVGAAEVAKERVKDAEATSSEIEKIALVLEQKIEKIREEFVKKRLESNVDRVKLAKKTADQITKLEQKAAEDIIKEQERIVKAAEKAAERRIKAEEKIRKEIEKSTKTLKDLADQLNEIAKKEEDSGGSALGSLADEATTLAEKLEEAADSLNKLFGDPGVSKDPTEFLNKGFKDLETLLGGVSTSFGTYSEELQQLGGQTEEFKDFTEQLKDAISKVKAEIENFGPSTQESLGIVLSGFEALVEQGFVSQQAFEQFGPEIKDVLAAAGDAAKVAAEKVSALAGKSKDIEALGEAGEKGAEGIKKIGEESETSGVKIVKTKDGLLEIVNAAEKLEEAGDKGAEGVEKLGTAAEKAAPPLEKVAAAAEKLQEPILDEGQVTKLEAFGEAAAKAQEPVKQLAEPVERIAAGALDLSVALPIVTTELAAITPDLEKLLGLLRDDPLDLAAIATQLQTIAGPLAEIGIALTIVTAAIVALPEPLAKVNEFIGPLFKLISAAAEDGSIIQVGAGFETIAKAVPKIPKPVEAFVEALQALVELRDQITTTLTDTATGLEEAGSEELRSDLEDLGTKLADIAKAIGEAATKTGAWKEALDPLQGVLQGTVTEAGNLASTLRDDLNPQFDQTETQAGKAADEVDRLEGEIGEAEQKIVQLGETMGAVSAQVVSDFAAMTAAANEFAAAANAAAEAAAEINVPQA